MYRGKYPGGVRPAGYHATRRGAVLIGRDVIRRLIKICSAARACGSDHLLRDGWRARHVRHLPALHHLCRRRAQRHAGRQTAGPQRAALSAHVHDVTPTAGPTPSALRVH